MRWLLIVLVVVFLVLPVGLVAQDEAPLLTLLAHVPDTAVFRDTTITYQDFRAVDMARDYLDLSGDLQTWLEYYGDLRLALVSRWLSAPPSVIEFFNFLVGMPQTVGFDFFEIERTLNAGSPPATLTVWQVDYDASAVADAHTARGYSQTELNGVPAWCPAEGCAAGSRVNVSGVERSNVFDPALGRQVPFLMQPGLLLSSPSADSLMEAADVIAGGGDSLADRPAYRALAEALTMPYDGLLVNAQFLANTDVRLELDLNNPGAVYMLLGALQPADAPAQPAWLDGYGVLPAYEQAAIADRQEGDRQFVIVALAYTTEDDAVTAAVELAGRLERYTDAFTRRTGEALFSTLPGVVFRQYVYASDSTGLYVAVAEIDYETPSEEDETRSVSAEASPVRPALGFVYLQRALLERAFYPLLVTTE